LTIVRLRAGLYDLRKDLRRVLEADVITYTGDRYRLSPQHVDVDLRYLTAAIEQAATAVDPDAHTRALHDIVGLYTGDVAGGESWLWLAPQREAIRRHVLDASTRLADTETDTRAGLALIQEAIGIDAYNEDLHQRAVRMHAAPGSVDGVRHLHVNGVARH
jgi:DNA-binding SARP family transcriptional activator